MKKKVIALVMLMLAVVCIWLAIHATQNAILAWIGAVAFILLAFHSWMGKKKQFSESIEKSTQFDSTVKNGEIENIHTQQAKKFDNELRHPVASKKLATKRKEEHKSTKAEYDDENSEIVFIMKNGSKYHQFDSCKHIHGLDSIAIRKGKAKKDGYHPCKECYPYGD